ncbi:MAG TPA: hypothetical protein VJM14_16890 [Burkholderiales bacterium]|nr:hypothetical protein [Burkholderiales bacterium]
MSAKLQDVWHYLAIIARPRDSAFEGEREYDSLRGRLDAFDMAAKGWAQARSIYRTMSEGMAEDEDFPLPAFWDEREPSSEKELVRFAEVALRLLDKIGSRIGLDVPRDRWL